MAPAWPSSPRHPCDVVRSPLWEVRGQTGRSWAASKRVGCVRSGTRAVEEICLEAADCKSWRSFLWSGQEQVLQTSMLSHWGKGQHSHSDRLVEGFNTTSGGTYFMRIRCCSWAKNTGTFQFPFCRSAVRILILKNKKIRISILDKKKCVILQSFRLVQP